MGILEDLDKLVQEVKDLRAKVDAAKWHIKSNIHLFKPQELECLILDNLIEPEDVPEDKRTEFIKKLVEEGEHG